MNYTALSKVSGISKIAGSDIVQVCEEYLQMFSWVLNYYLVGYSAVNLEFYYRQFFAPLVKDLAVVCNTARIKTLSEYKSEPDFVPSKSGGRTIFVSPIHQQLIVLPPQSAKLMPCSIRFLSEEDSVIGDYFPISCPIVLDHVNDEYMGVIIVPLVSLDRVIDAVNKMCAFSEDEASLYEVEGDQLYLAGERLKEINGEVERIEEESKESARTKINIDTVKTNKLSKETLSRLERNPYLTKVLEKYK